MFKMSAPLLQKLGFQDNEIELDNGDLAEIISLAADKDGTEEMVSKHHIYFTCLRYLLGYEDTEPVCIQEVVDKLEQGFRSFCKRYHIKPKGVVNGKG